MLRLSKLHKPTNARFLLSCLNLGSNQGSNPVLSASLAVRAGYLTQLLPSLSSLHTSCTQRIMSCTSFNFISYVHFTQGNLQTEKLRTAFPFSTSTKCMQENLANLLQEVKAKEYIPVYFHKKIKFIRIFCTMSKLSTYFFVVGVPVSLAAMLMDIISQNSAVNIIFTMGFYFFVFTGHCYLIMSKVICKIMVSKDESYVQISHLNLFGQRKDIYVKVSDIIPVSGSLYDKKIHSIQLKGRSKKLYLMTDAGGNDTDFETLEILFSGARQDEAQS